MKSSFRYLSNNSNTSSAAIGDLALCTFSRSSAAIGYVASPVHPPQPLLEYCDLQTNPQMGRPRRGPQNWVIQQVLTSFWLHLAWKEPSNAHAHVVNPSPPPTLLAWREPSTVPAHVPSLCVPEAHQDWILPQRNHHTTSVRQLAA